MIRCCASCTTSNHEWPRSKEACSSSIYRAVKYLPPLGLFSILESRASWGKDDFNGHEVACLVGVGVTVRRFNVVVHGKFEDRFFVPASLQAIIELLWVLPYQSTWLALAVHVVTLNCCQRTALVIRP